MEHGFGGYIHLKAVPGASEELMLQAGQWADRLSANVELARDSDLAQLAPAKTHKEIELSMRQIANGILEAKDKTNRQGKSPRFAPAGQSTQFIVGAPMRRTRCCWTNRRSFIKHVWFAAGVLFGIQSDSACRPGATAAKDSSGP